MEALEVHGRPVARCPRCGGFWMAHEALASLLDEVFGAPVELVEFPDGSPRKACPVCMVEMEQVWLELLGLERCPLHGVWIDRGELGRILKGDVVPPLPRPAPEPKDER
jgi:Zn-finger nucleic acid-binding protein